MKSIKIKGIIIHLLHENLPITKYTIEWSKKYVLVLLCFILKQTKTWQNVTTFTEKLLETMKLNIFVLGYFQISRCQNMSFRLWWGGRPKCGHSWPSNHVQMSSHGSVRAQKPSLEYNTLQNQRRARCEYYNRVLLKGRVQTTLINTWSTVGTSSPTQIKWSNQINQIKIIKSNGSST